VRAGIPPYSEQGESRVPPYSEQGESRDFSVLCAGRQEENFRKVSRMREGFSLCSEQDFESKDSSIKSVG